MHQFNYRQQMNYMISKAYRIILTIVLVTSIFSVRFAFASEAQQEQKATHQAAEKFNAGEMIFHHILDNHEWHIMTIGHTHVTVPLPIILLDNGKLEMFCSSKFHHGKEAYKGYMLSHEGPNKGKIVKVDINNKEIKGASLPLDFSITKVVLALFVSFFIIAFIFLSVANRYKKYRNQSPKGLQSMIEPLIIFVRDDIAKPSIGEHKYEKYMPYLLTLFFFIFINNLMGLIPLFPFGANVTGNIAVTLVMALITFVITTLSSNKNYWMHIFNAPGVPWWLKFPIPLMPVVELMGVFIKPFVLMVRLFANITAGHIIILGFMSLIFIFGEMTPVAGYGASVLSIAFGVFMSLLELLVAFIQAYVFTLLSALYFGMAMEEHHHEEQHA